MKANELEVVNIRLVPDRTFFSEKPIRSPQDAVSFIAEHLSDYDREVLAVLNLNTKGKVLNMNFVSVGTINASLVEPREFFKSTILSNAAGVIMIHNHPSGDPTPSNEDKSITKRIAFVSRMCGISFVDHVIVGGGHPPERFSFKEHGLIENLSKDQIAAEVRAMNL